MRDNTWGITLTNGKEIEGNAQELVTFSKKYPTKNISTSVIHPWGLWHDYGDAISGAGIKYKDMTKKEQNDFDKELNTQIEKADLQYPIIIFIDEDGYIASIPDGHHRIEKAYRHKFKTIKAKLIPEKDAEKEFSK